LCNKIKNKEYHAVGTVLKYHAVGTVLKYHAVGTVPKSNSKIVRRDKINTPNTQIHDYKLSCIGTGTSMKRDWVILDVWAQTIDSSWKTSGRSFQGNCTP